MSTTKHILLFGAGKSATVLINYLKGIATTKSWQVTIADVNLAAVQSKVGDHKWVNAVGLSIEHVTERRALINQADVVISMLPPTLHYLVALDCLAFKKNLLTASYIDANLKALSNELKANGILFLCEMGLDPGIDHMSAMQLIHRIKREGGVIKSFISHCGGLVAPESDDNPWHYKISWNARNIVMAGSAGAVFKENSKVKSLNYENLFADCGEVTIEELGKLAYYFNRDSLSYISTYQLEEANTFMRTTLRYPDFCKGWHLVIQLGMTDENKQIDTKGRSVASFFQQCFAENQLLIEDQSETIQEQFLYLGMEDESLLNIGVCSYAAVLQSILERKWKLAPSDKDMIVMLHEVVYEVKGQTSIVRSSLLVKGTDHLHTAMAKTVGLPLGIAATLLLEGKITETGLHIPIVAGIYEPVLNALIAQGIQFKETITHL